jgi:hypothetical protein
MNGRLDARGGAAALVAIVVAATVVALHARGLPGSFLADDISHLIAMSTVDREGRLGAWLAERFVDELHNGNFAFRPVLFLSYAVDWRLFGAHATAWQLENLLLHLVNAALAGRVASRWSRERGRAAAAIAAASFAAYPFAGEVSYWAVGRANLLAALFGLLFLLALREAAGASAWRHAARIVLLYASLLSNESAMPLAFVAALLVFARRPEGELFRRRAAATVREMVSVWIAFGVYLAWRLALFGTPLKVYPQSSAPGASQLVERLGRVLSIFERQPAIDPPLAWTAVLGALLVAVALLALPAARRSAGVLVAFALAACAYLIAPSLSIELPATGEGARNYYLPWIFVACTIGLTAASTRAAETIAVGLLAWLLVAQEGSLRQWQYAASAMREVTSAIPRFARTLAPGEFAALLLPDHIGVALFDRNAQAGIAMWPVQQADLSDRVAGMTELDIERWRDRLAGRVEPIDPAKFAGVFCFDPSRGGFVRIARGGALPGDAWRRELGAAVAANRCLRGTFSAR